METISESSGNVFADLGFSPEESAQLAMRAELMARLCEMIAERGWTQPEAASQLGIGQSRISDLARGKPEFAVIPIELYDRLSAALEDADDAARFDAACAADDGFRIPAAVVNGILDGEQPVKVWREHRGLTQDALAAKAGISKPYLCQIETRKRVGALKTLQAIASALAVGVDDLQDA